MKKLLSILLVMVMALSLGACGKTTNKDDGKDDEQKIDMSQYPANFSEWTGDTILKYFTDAGVFKNQDWAYVQKEDELTGTGFSNCASYMSKDDSSVMVFIWYFDPNTTDEAVKQQLEYIKQNKTTNETTGSIAIDHLVGNFAFSYGKTADLDVYDAMDAAYQQLVKDMKLSPEF